MFSLPISIVSLSVSLSLAIHDIQGAPTDRFYPGTVLTNVDHTMDIMIHESFGPVIGIMKVESDEEAVKLMNDTAFGLTASVFTASQEKAENILSQVRK